jgi:hypothetical protein
MENKSGLTLDYLSFIYYNVDMRSKPIGTTRINHMVYVLIKTYQGQRRWSFLHRIIWESIHGSIPKNVFIHHKNEDKTDNRIENLEICKSNAEHHKKYHIEKAKEWGRKLGSLGKGIPQSLDHRAKISAANKGVPKSPEHKRKISLSLKGRIRPDISVRLKGRKLSPEHREKVIAVYTRLHRDPLSGQFEKL